MAFCIVTIVPLQNSVADKHQRSDTTTFHFLDAHPTLALQGRGTSPWPRRTVRRSPQWPILSSMDMDSSKTKETHMLAQWHRGEKKNHAHHARLWRHTILLEGNGLQHPELLLDGLT